MSRKHSPNFSEAELEILIDGVERNRSVLFSKLSHTTTNVIKSKIWETICSKVNSANSKSYKRTVEELRKKWSPYSSSIKKTASLNRREARKIGGGGPPEQLTALQDKVVGILGNTPTEGIGGETDTLADETTEEPHADSDQTSDFGVENEEGCSSWPDNILPLQDSELSNDTLRVNQTASKLSTSCRKQKATHVDVQLINIEQSRLSVERERLKVEQDRLEIDKQRLDVEKK